MKHFPLLVMFPVTLGIGFLIGKQSLDTPETKTEADARNARTLRPIRSSHKDPFGGPSFSLSSMEEVRELFKKQRSSVAMARLTLSVEEMSAAEISAMMEMIQKDTRENPRDYEGRYQLMGCLFERWVQVNPTAAVGFITSCKSRSFQLQAAGSCFSALAQADPTRALVELDSLAKGEVRKRAGVSMLGELAKSDPGMACDLAERESGQGGYVSYYLGQVFATWAKTDPEAAAARYAAMPPDKVGENAAGQLAESWAKSDPEAALAWAKTLKGDSKTYSSVAVYRVLSIDDPDAAWERLKTEPGYLRGKLISGVLNTVADEDPKKAAQMLKSIDSKSEKRIAAGEFLQRLSWNNARLAFDILDEIDDPTIRRQRLGQTMYQAAWNSPELLKEQIVKLSDREKIETSGAVLRGMIETDPAAAERYYLALPESQRNTWALNEMMSSYSDRDPKKAFDFAVSLENSQEKTNAINGVFANWSREDPEAAAEGWKQLPPGDSRLGALGQIAGSWANADPIAAKEWANSLSGDERVRALAAVLPSLANDNPNAASSQLAALIASPPDGMAKDLAGSAGSFARKWASDDPAAAADWAAGLPDGQSRDAGLKAVAQSWSSYDAIGTAEWLGTLEAGSSRDAAIEPLVNQVRQTDPATAFSWAASISDEHDRLNQLRQTLQSWRGSDLDGARAALERADLSKKNYRELAKELE